MNINPSFDPIERLAGLQRGALQAEAHWAAKLKAGIPPVMTPVASYTLKLNLKGESPFLVAWINRRRGRLTFAKTWRSDAAVELDIALLNLDDWEAAQQTVVGLGEADAGLAGPVQLHTGEVYTWAIDRNAAGYRRQMLCVALEDTEDVRGRWRLKPALWMALPPALAFLKTGRCQGGLRLE